MKKIVKRIYMLLFHPILFFRYTLKNNLVVQGKNRFSNLNCLEIGKDVRIGDSNQIKIYGTSDNNKKLILEDNVYICDRCSILVSAPIKIGKKVGIASDVLITSYNHGMDPEHEECYCGQPLTSEREVSVGEGTWVGQKVVIMPGVTIGKKCIIGAASVITHDVPDYCIVAGNPARVIKKYNFKKKVWEKII